MRNKIHSSLVFQSEEDVAAEIGDEMNRLVKNSPLGDITTPEAVL